MAVLAVLVDHGVQGRRVIGGRSSKSQPDLGMGLDAQAQRHGTDRVEAGVELQRWRCPRRVGSAG